MGSNRRMHCNDVDFGASDHDVVRRLYVQLYTSFRRPRTQPPHSQRVMTRQIAHKVPPPKQAFKDAVFLPRSRCISRRTIGLAHEPDPVYYHVHAVQPNVPTRVSHLTPSPRLSPRLCLPPSRALFVHPPLASVPPFFGALLPDCRSPGRRPQAAHPP